MSPWSRCNPWPSEVTFNCRRGPYPPGACRTSSLISSGVVPIRRVSPSAGGHACCHTEAREDGTTKTTKKTRSRERRTSGLERLRAAREVASEPHFIPDGNSNPSNSLSVESLKRNLQRMLDIRERLQQCRNLLQARRAQVAARNNRISITRKYLGLHSERGSVSLQYKKASAQGDVVFLAIDTEGGDKAVTEVGLALLDTRTINGVRPGPGAREWYKHIQTRHLALRRCERFRFGTTEQVPAAAAFRSHINHMFNPLRKYVVVGHSMRGDLDKLSKHLRCEIPRMPNVVGQIDTMEIVRGMPVPQKLSRLWMHLGGLDLRGEPETRFAFHNAGNDAVYTLQVLLTLAATPESEWVNPRRNQSQDMVHQHISSTSYLTSKLNKTL